MAILRGTNLVEFQYLKSELDVSDSDLSKQMTALTTAGMVSARKRREGQSRSTWYRMTAKGRLAFDRHVQSLEALIELSKQLDDPDPDPGAETVDAKAAEAAEADLSR